MLTLRLRWYAHETSRVLLRHWQVLVLTLMLVLPSMPVFAQARILGAPVLATLAPARGIEWQFLWVHALEAIGALWVLAQRRAISGGAFAAFVRSLPIPEWRGRTVDLAVLVLASTPLLLSVVAAVIALATHPGAHYLYVIDLTLITLAAQLAVLHRKRQHLWPLVAANVLLVAGLQIAGTSGYALLIGALLIALWSLTRSSVAQVSLRKPSAVPFNTLAASEPRRFPPVVRLQAGILRRHSSALLGRCLMMTAIAGVTVYLIRLWEFDGRTLPLVLISQAAIVLVAAMHYRELSAAHQRAAHFTRSLPRRPFVQTFADVATVAALALPFVAVGPVYLALNGTISVASALIVLIFGLPLVALLRLPQRYVPKQSVLIGATLAALWVTAAWLCLVP
ncbi:hypothetical protein PPN31114_02150 [Pandoraea pneumonica]|jgi:hypothetical protein|uniref:Uncharacterized protein n=1 Tax=Pandoraea pneumonica TaxID=2508299 RepID=A0A5E4UNJ8_9BURK|nr:DUF6136 family protein [Pandoraea pneumonica]VVE01601.1 hypothetical protein PPN31114_02150 [Pandoraea pneumonica]